MSDERLVKGGITNLDTAEFRAFHFNPAVLEVSVEPRYSEQASLGGTGQRLHFNYVGNEKIPLELLIDRMALFEELQMPGETDDSLKERVDEEISDYIRFMWSLCFPVGLQSDPIRRAPPKVMFIWPSLMNLQVRIRRESLSFQKFTKKLSPWRLSIRLEMDVINPQRLLSSQIRQIGFMRAGLGEQ